MKINLDVTQTTTSTKTILYTYYIAHSSNSCESTRLGNESTLDELKNSLRRIPGRKYIFLYTVVQDGEEEESLLTPEFVEIA